MNGTKVRRGVRCALMCAGAMLLSSTSLAFGAGADREALLQAEIDVSSGVSPQQIITLEALENAPGIPVIHEITLGEDVLTLTLAPYSVRSSQYQILAQLENGEYVKHAPGPVRTLRGTFLERPDAQIAGAMLDDGLFLSILLDGERFWMEPVPADLPSRRPGDHMLYTAGDVHPHDMGCGVQHQPLGREAMERRMPNPQGAAGGGGVCIAELACDADTEYFNAYGSVANVEARVNSVINTVNQQYEAQVGISHQITTIIVRTGADPYTSTDAQTRLCQFITEWTNNQQAVQRDVAHLFTGVNLSGSTIGIAADIGNTGICQNSGGCSGGTYGTFGSYCLSQSDFNGNFSCATDLTAHELGHLWGAFHCSCSGNTMNSSITCANSFSGGTINSIIAYRDSRTCLSGNCSGGPAGPENDDCADATAFNDGNGDGVIAYSTLGATTDGPANPTNTCNDFGQNQTWNDIWYTYDATCSGTLTITTCDDIHGAGDPTYDTDLVVYGPYASAGNINCGSLASNLLACNDDDPSNPCGTSAPYSSTIEINVSAGSTYLIRVGGWSSAESGSGFLSVNCAGTTPTGACCFGDGSCSILTAADCAAQGGTYQGDGVSCAAANCPQPIGACCFGDGSCAQLTASDCTAQGGTYQGDGVSCAAANCPQPPATGACCFGDGSCSILTAGDCASQGGAYQGDDVTCAAANCPQPPATGACCFPDGSCDVFTEADCLSFGGTYAGDDVTCAAANCPQPTGACCFGDGSCAVLTASDCAAQGGTYEGDGVSCAAANCPQPAGVTLETGSVVAGGSPVTVNLANTYASPVVVCSILYQNNGLPVVARVSNVTATSFDVRLQNPSGAGVAAEVISYLVVEEGVYDVNGVRFEAQTYVSTVTDRKSSWNGQAQSYGQSYTNPIVVGQVMSENDPDWSFFWCRGSSRQSPPSSSTLRTGKGVGEDPDTTRVNEVVGFIVFEAGAGTLGGVEFEAGLSNDSIRGVGNSPPYTAGFSAAFSGAPEVGVVTQAAMDGNDGGWALHWNAPSSTALFLAIDEDQLSNNERRHTTEQVGYVVFRTNVLLP